MHATRVALALTALLASGTLATAAELNLPARKAGEWKIEMQVMAGAPAMQTRLCLDAETDKQLMAKGTMLSGDCSKMDMKQENGGYVIDAECTVGAMKSKTHTVMTGDFQSTYKMEITSDTEGGPKQMPPHSTMTQTATWTGPCTDLKPGEMEMRGMKINALQMMGGG
jgi:hypothetical protein